MREETTMHKFYWNNKQSRDGCNESVGEATTNNTVFDKSRQNTTSDTKGSVCTNAGRKGSGKMSYSKSEYNFNSANKSNATDLVSHNQPNPQTSNNSFDEYGATSPQLPKRSDSGIKTVVRVTTSPLRNEDSSSKYQLSSSKSQHDMRTHLQPKGQHNISNNNETPTSKANKAPVGSHRVLLKLRRLSGRDTRPKSVHGAENIECSKVKTGNDTKDPKDQSDSVSLKGISSSRSMHQFYFYNRTWNERSLQKYASSHNNPDSQHNYENVYSGFQEDENSANYKFKAPPTYENITVASEYQQNVLSGNNPLIIDTLTCSPKSSARAGSRISIIPSDYSKEQHKDIRGRQVQNSNQNWVPTSSFNPQQYITPIPPERKGRRNDRNRLENRAVGNDRGDGANSASMNNENSHRQLYRSKSCERPKMKDSVRDTFKLLSNETSDRLQNNFNRFSSNFTDKFLASNSIINKFACGSGSGNGSTRSSNSSYNGKSSHSSKLSSTGGDSDYGSCKNSNTSYKSSNEHSLQTNNSLQSAVGMKHFIPCVDMKVRHHMNDPFYDNTSNHIYLYSTLTYSHENL